MSDITITEIRHGHADIRIVRQKFWTIGRTLKVVELRRNSQFRWMRFATPFECTSRFFELGFAVPRVRYPRKLRWLQVELSTGKVLTVHDRTIPVVKQDAAHFSRDLYKWHKPDKKSECERYICHLNSHRIPRLAEFHLALPNDTVLTYDQACRLKVGQVVGRDKKPLRLDLAERCITDGNYRFPLTRPFRSKWTYSGISFASGHNAANWLLFLKTIHGQYVDDIIDIKKTRERMQSIKRQRQNRERIQRIGQCFRGHKAISSVSIGKNLLFTLQRGEEELFVVDSPEYANALYVFDSRDDAMAWATRAITWREARERARLVRTHHGNWKEQVNLALA